MLFMERHSEHLLDQIMDYRRLYGYQRGGWLSIKINNDTECKLWLLTPLEFLLLPIGTTVFSILGTVHVVGHEEFDLTETRCGFLAFGFPQIASGTNAAE